MKPKALIVYISVAGRKEADTIAKHLVQARLAACVGILPEMYSRYWWKGRVEHGREMLLLVKTSPRLYRRLERKVRELHSYTVPEILAVPVVHGNKDYLKWMKDVLQ